MQEMRKQSRLEREAKVGDPKLLRPERGESREGRPATCGEEEEEDETQAFKAQLANVMERVNTRQGREQEAVGVPCNFGPAFDLAFSSTRGDESD